MKNVTGTFKQLTGGFLTILLLISCGNNQAVKYPDDTTRSGTINISVDESMM